MQKAKKHTLQIGFAQMMTLVNSLFSVLLGMIA